MPDMPNLITSPTIITKLSGKKPPVTRAEVIQCFQNRSGKLLMDTREKHASNPPTLWFVALTNAGRALKIVYIHEAGKIYLRSAFEPNADELYIYKQYG